MNSRQRIRLAAAAFLVVSLLTSVVNRPRSPEFLFYVLYPGLMVDLAINGGHGGTEAEEFWGMVAGVVVNFIVYYLLFLLVAALWRRLRKAPSALKTYKPSNRIAIISALIAVVVVIALSRIAWIRQWNAKVTVDGSYAESARVYKDRRGDILIDLRDPSGKMYIVQDGIVGVPNPPFLMESAPLAFAKESPINSWVDIRADKAGGVDPQLTMDSRMLRFSRGDGVIQVHWK